MCTGSSGTIPPFRVVPRHVFLASWGGGARSGVSAAPCQTGRGGWLPPSTAASSGRLQSRRARASLAEPPVHSCCLLSLSTVMCEHRFPELSDPLELEFQAVVSCLTWVLGTELWSSLPRVRETETERQRSALNHRAISRDTETLSRDGSLSGLERPCGPGNPVCPFRLVRKPTLRAPPSSHAS